MVKKFAKITDNKTKACSVFLGKETPENIKYATETLKMNLLDVEESTFGGWYLKGFAPQKTLEKLKQEKIEQLKQNTFNYITKQYPIYKQINILRSGIEKDLTQMSQYIDNIRNQVDIIEKQINSCNTKEELENIINK